MKMKTMFYPKHGNSNNLMLSSTSKGCMYQHNCHQSHPLLWFIFDRFDSRDAILMNSPITIYNKMDLLSLKGN